MKKSLRNFILNLSGPPSSYCTCNKLCSPIEIDHVVPQKFLKQKITDKKKLSDALNDPHNLYRCCSYKNRKKGHNLLTQNYPGDEFSGLLARSYLYMIWRYSISTDKNLFSTAESMNTLHSPFTFERKRMEEIRFYNGQTNPFIKYYHGTKDKY